MSIKKMFLSALLAVSLSQFIIPQDFNDLTITSEKEVSQIEKGNHFIGIEIHKSFPLLNRISFYYPVANSIDISDDYWKRDQFRIMSIGLKVGNAPKRLLKEQIYKVTQTPYSVCFTGIDSGTGITINYEFCKNEPAMVITYEIKNLDDKQTDYEIFTCLNASLRTSHTYSKINQAYSEYYDKNSTIILSYPFTETADSKIFISNAGLQPASWTSLGTINSTSLDAWWLKNNSDLIGINKNNITDPVLGFIYRQRLFPDETMKIVQVVGSLAISDSLARVNQISGIYSYETDSYKNYILNSAINDTTVLTDDKILDFTTFWSKAILSTNKHFINGEIVPMPAPAEYNFYFTHDVLLTDLAAVNFDGERVKNDLKFIISLADSNQVIPHAFYWKDKTFKTEYAGTENWNHLWFTLVAARYIRHTNDSEFLKIIYPYVFSSINTALKNKGNDGLMWSFRPDWWDIGNNFGPRSYMTILTIRALKEFNYLTWKLKQNQDPEELKYLDELTQKMTDDLNIKLWDDQLNYLISYFNDGSEDRHIYMGSLLASHFNLLDFERNNKLLSTAKTFLLDNKIGLRTIFPMDLHLLNDYMGFVNNETGNPFYYANGGVWPHGNAWYALALISNNFKDEAYKFIKEKMTIAGVINSPNGQPALYEYRVSDSTNSNYYGKIDKPQFLWAGGWYLYTMYNLFGVRENEWNISFDPYLPAELKNVILEVLVKNQPVRVSIYGNGENVSSIKYDQKDIPSLVIPGDNNPKNEIAIKLGNEIIPLIKSINSEIFNLEYDKNRRLLKFSTESNIGRELTIEIISANGVEGVVVDKLIKGTELYENKIIDKFITGIKYRVKNINTNFEIYLK